MKFLNRFLENVHQKLPSLAAVFLMLPVLILAWFVAKEPFLSVASGDLSRYVLSGKLFSENFNTIHAGSGLDQPTIVLQREVVVIYPGYTRLIDRLRCPILADGEEFVSCGSRGLVDSVSDNM